MKTLFTRFILIFAAVAALFGMNRKKDERSSENDAIRLPEFEQKDLVEDYEMAAYHNQA